VTGRRARLGRLEAQAKTAADFEVIGFYEADPAVGLWRDMNTGQTRPMSPDEIEEARAACAVGGMRLQIGPLPGGRR
jgi:hypothetical protein